MAPITLSCGHTQCRVCVRKLGMDKEHVKCGMCPGKTWAPANTLSKNYQMVDILDKHGLLDADGPDCSRGDQVASSSGEATRNNLPDEMIPSTSTNVEMDEETERVLMSIRENVDVVRNGIDSLYRMVKDDIPGAFLIFFKQENRVKIVFNLIF